ncbi:MAG: hypothetical protein CMJ48_04780 [Planctomycetaceae bacterium]|nr:hypothetical protein [Planctomycetaceae bacterium]
MRIACRFGELTVGRPKTGIVASWSPLRHAGSRSIVDEGRTSRVPDDVAIARFCSKRHVFM